MRNPASRAACLVAGATLAMGLSLPVFAQSDTARKAGSISGAVEIGARSYTHEPAAVAKGKFFEYRDVRNGAVPEQFLLRWTPADSFGLYEIGGRELMEKDRSLWMNASRPGRYNFQAHYDGIPHTYSTTARSLLTATSPNVFTLPTPRPDSVAWRAAPYLSPVAVKWDATNVSLGVTPTATLESKAEYTRMGKSGSRPLSLSYAGAGGPTIEFPSPVNESINNLKFTQAYTNPRLQLVGSVAYSSFTNQNPFAEIANPFSAIDTPTGGAAFSRVALAPDNTAKTAVVHGSVNLSAHTRISGSAAMSWFSQDAVLAPQTSNTLLASDPLLVLPRTSFNGQAKTSNFTLSAASRPLTNLRLVAKFRSFDYSNQSDPFHIRAMAVSDRSIAPADSFTSEHHPFTKNNTDLSANYQLFHSLSMTAGYGYETWKRDPDVRDIAKTTEGTPRVSMDYTGIEWVTLRGSYSKGWRRGDNYIDSTSDYDFPGYRRFDLGPRDRARSTFEAAFTPLDEVSVALSWQDWNDKYPVAYGTQSERSSMLGGDADWTPVKGFSIGAGYSVEYIDYIMKSRYKTGARGTATFDNSTWIWFSVDKGKSITEYLSFSAALIPDKVDAGGSISTAYSRFFDHNYNPAPPSGGTVAQNYAATAYDFPVVWSRKRPISVFVSYRVRSDLGMTVRYQRETFRQSDFRSLNPDCYDKVTAAAPLPVDPNCQNSNRNIPEGADLSTAIGNFRFLGNNYRGFDAGWVTVTFSYRPAAIPFTRRRSTL